jgi:integrase
LGIELTLDIVSVISDQPSSPATLACQAGNTVRRTAPAMGLRWEDVDMASGFLVVTQQITEVRGRSVLGTPKTKRGARVVPLDADTTALLRRHRDAQDVERHTWGQGWTDTGLVFTREDGTALRPEYVTRHFQALAADAGLPPIRLHDLRHTNASIALAAGVDMKVVSDRLGHSQMSVTADLYSHVSVQLGQRAAEQIAGALRPSPGAVPSPFLPQHPDAASQTAPEEPL